MTRSTPVDGFELAYDRVGGPVRRWVLLHGWPGDPGPTTGPWPAAGRPAPRWSTPDLRGFGESDKPAAAPVDQYTAACAGPQRRRAGSTSSGWARPVVVGYDVGSRVAQALAAARLRPGRGCPSLAPPLPGSRPPGARAAGDAAGVLVPALPPAATWPSSWSTASRDAVRDYLGPLWLALVRALIYAGSPAGPRAPGCRVLRPAGRVHRVDQLVPGGRRHRRRRPGRSRTGTRGSDRVCPRAVLWPEHDPLLPSGLVGPAGNEALFSDVTLQPAENGVGHFSPLEAPQLFAGAIRGLL